jgi:acetyl esterase/lipase
MSQRVMWLLGVVTVLGLGVVVWALGSPTQDPRPRIRQQNDVTFATVGGVALKLDLAMPEQGVGPFPAVVCLHGGGWVGGDRKQMAQTIEVLARRGYVAISPDYRPAPGHRFPACIEDCKTAVRWLRANGEKYNVDTARIGAVGLSAGAHLACLLGVTEPSDGLDGTTSYLNQTSRVQAVVAFAAPIDLTDRALHSAEVLKDNLIPLFNGTPAKRPEEYRKASPMSYSPKNPPPFLLIHGGADPIVPAQQARALADKLKQLGGKAQVVILEGEKHTWSGDRLRQSIDQMLTFLDETLQR